MRKKCKCKYFSVIVNTSQDTAHTCPWAWKVSIAKSQGWLTTNGGCVKSLKMTTHWWPPPTPPAPFHADPQLLLHCISFHICPDLWRVDFQHQWGDQQITCQTRKRTGGKSELETGDVFAETLTLHCKYPAHQAKTPLKVGLWWLMNK